MREEYFRMITVCFESTFQIIPQSNSHCFKKRLALLPLFIWLFSWILFFIYKHMCTLKWDVQFKDFLYAGLVLLSQIIQVCSLDIESLHNYTFGFRFATLQKNIVKSWGKSLYMTSVHKDLLRFTWLSKYVLFTCH